MKRVLPLLFAALFLFSCREETTDPDAAFAGRINGATYGSTGKFFQCGTEKSRLKPGKDTVVVTLSEGPTEPLFDLRYQ